METVNPRCRWRDEAGDQSCPQQAVTVVSIKLRGISSASEVMAFRMCRRHKDLIVMAFEAEGFKPVVIAGCPRD